MKLFSNVLFLVAMALVVVGILVGGALFYALGALLFVASFLVTVLKRRQFRARKAATPQP